jgi:hypothetical protein
MNHCTGRKIYLKRQLIKLTFAISKTAMKYATIIITAFFLYFLSGNIGKPDTGKNLNNAPVTQYFYFEMIPVKLNLPYYFSQVISVSYNDDSDFIRQRRLYFHELKAQIILDGHDTLDYKSYNPMGVDTKSQCDNLKIGAENALAEDNKKVLDITLH